MIFMFVIFHVSLDFHAVLQSGSKQRVVRRDSSLHVELGELTTEVDLDIISRLESIIQALSHNPSQLNKPTNTQVLPWTSACIIIICVSAMDVCRLLPITPLYCFFISNYLNLSLHIDSVIGAALLLCSPVPLCCAQASLPHPWPSTFRPEKTHLGASSA